MRKAEARWWTGTLLVIFIGTIAFNILRREGGLNYYLYSLDGVEILGTLFMATLGTFLTIWHASILFGLIFVIGLLLALGRSGRLRGQIPSILIFAVMIVLPCMLLWKLTRHHLPTAGGMSLSLFWLASPVILYLCVRHAIIRKDDTWSLRDRRIAYLGASVTLLMGSLSFGTMKSDGEVQRSLDLGRNVVYAIKHFQEQNKRLPDTLNDLVPAYFSNVPETEVPRGWNGHQAYVYTKQGDRAFSVTFEAASYVSCGYERGRDSWECG